MNIYILYELYKMYKNASLSILHMFFEKTFKKT